jgi:murein tripeptide amidase MpaA
LDNNYKMYCNVQENHTRLFYFIFEKDRQIIIDNCKNELDILFDIN